MTTTASSHTTTSWDSSSSGYVPPPRFQQLLVNSQRDQQQGALAAQSQAQFPAGTGPNHSGVYMAPGSEQASHQRPPLSNNQNHARSSSIFSFRNRQTSESSATGQPRSPSILQKHNPERTAHPPQPVNRSIPQGPSPQYSPSPPQQQHQPEGQHAQQHQPPAPSSPPIQQQQPSQLARTLSSQKPPAPTPPLHPEIRSVVSLTTAHAHKIYFSGPLVRRIERQPDGQKPAKDEGWTEVWAQLGGTTLSIWDMKQIQEASKQGKEVPPAYVNMTDAFIQVLGSVTVPATQTAPAQRYTNVLTLNTAGSNLLLFSCPSTASLISWAAALRLSAWEKSRLEEIYTAHVIRITLPKRDITTNLIQGRLEGWVRVRIAGQTDWKRMWMAVSAGADNPALGERPGSQNSGRVGSTPTPQAPKKKRMSSLFSRDQVPAISAVPPKPVISFYPTQKPKDRRRPLLTVASVSQAFAVYPERPELISRSTLIKVEGVFGDEDLAATMRTREGWVLIMPEVEGGLGQASEMLKWIVALHDAFELYGRPEAWSWDPRDPGSLMFAYPVGPHKDLLFLDRELAETLDPRDDRTSAIRSRLRDILLERMGGGEPGPMPASRASSDAAPSLPPIGEDGLVMTNGPQLPPLNFSSTSSKTALSPITERSSVQTQGAPSTLGTYPVGEPLVSLPQQAPDQNQISNQNQAQHPDQNHDATQHQPPNHHQNGFLGGPLSYSPVSTTSTSQPPVVHQIRVPSPSSDKGAPSPAAMARLDSAPKPDGPNLEPSAHLVVGTKPMDNTTTKNAMSSPTTATLTSMAAFSSPSEWSSNTHPTLGENRPGPLTPQSQHSLGAPTANRNTLSDRTSVTTSPRSIDQGSRVSVDRASHLTSPHSIKDDEDLPADHSPLKSPHSAVGHGNDLSVKIVPSDGHFLSSPYSPVNSTRRLSSHTHGSGPSSPSQSLSSPNTSHFSMQRAPGSPAANFNDAGGSSHPQQKQQSEAVLGDQIRRKPTTISEKDNESSESTLPVSETNPTGIIEPVQDEISTSAGVSSNSTRAMPVRQSTPMAFQRLPSLSKSPVATSHSGPGSRGGSGRTPADRLSPTPRPGLGRKPSGARAPANNRPYNGDSFSSSQQVTETEDDSQSEQSMNDIKKVIGNGLGNPPRPSASSDEPDLDALAALSYLDVNDDEKTASPPTAKVAPLNVRTSDRHDTSSPQPISAVSVSSQPFKSSFAPSKQALERMAKAQAQQEAHHAAAHKPGRANGKKKPKVVNKGAWGESSDEEEEEEEEEDVDSDDPPQANRQPTPSSGLNSSNNSTRPSQQHPNQAVPSPLNAQMAQDRLRQQPRTLPQIPGGGFQSEHDEYPHPQPPRRMADQYPEAARRTQYDDGPQIRSQAEFPTPGAARQSMWSQVLDPGRTTGTVPTNTRDTFVQLEPAEAMTMAFTPQGLLSAGLQDKQDRSAKRQEELARETGASLINVPNKPPPPQTGLLGAITAHERERKREGGVGAALTEREREKRLAEERQRRFDDHQRQQLDQMQQGGSLYGGQFGYNPMMANPMMMGMNPMMMNPMMAGGGMAPMMTGGGGLSPMMTGGGMAPMMTGQMGYPGMMPGYNPQHMFAAQQAAQAYQQAMMAFSVAGSQAGGDGGAEGGANPQMLPNMTGNMQGSFDPRMSMMSMMGGPQMNPMGMQMTGMSGFDPRFPPSMASSPGVNDPNLLPPQALGQNHGNFSSRTSSPAGRGSPLAQSTEQADPNRGRSRPASPKP